MSCGGITEIGYVLSSSSYEKEEDEVEEVGEIGEEGAEEEAMVKSEDEDNDGSGTVPQ